MELVMDMCARVHVSLLVLLLLLGTHFSPATATCDLTTFGPQVTVQLIVVCAENELNITVSTAASMPSGNDNLVALSSGDNRVCFNQNGSIVPGSAMLAGLTSNDVCTIIGCSQVPQTDFHFVFVNSSCFQDIDECRVPDSCNAITEDCSNTMGGFNCICKTGFSLINNSICEDIDECEDPDICAGSDSFINSHCNNTLGGYECQCSEDEELLSIIFFFGTLIYCADHGNDFTFDVDCTTPGLFFTVVRNFKVDSRISPRIDVDYVCHDASGNQIATNGIDEAIPGSPYIITGVEQFQNGTQCTVFGHYGPPSNPLIIADSTCYLDHDECVEGNYNCSGDNVVCNNSLGSYDCVCMDGYMWTEDRSNCADIDECNVFDSCNITTENCSNAIGGYNCSCKTGFSPNNNSICEDDDECTDGVDNCAGENVVCVNEFGGYNCKCLMGYMWTKDRTECEDVNECWNIDSCNATTEDCSNTIGAFNCSCKEGFNRTNDICEDINECQNVTLALECVENSTCSNNPGSFECLCEAGLEGDGRIECKKKEDRTVLLLSITIPPFILIVIILIIILICILTACQHFKKRRIYNFDVHKHYYYMFGTDLIWKDPADTQLDLVDVKQSKHFYPKSPSVMTDLDELCYNMDLMLTETNLFNHKLSLHSTSDNDTRTPSAGSSENETIENVTVASSDDGSNGNMGNLGKLSRHVNVEPKEGSITHSHQISENGIGSVCEHKPEGKCTIRTSTPVTVEGQSPSTASYGYLSVTLPTPPGGMCNQGSVGTTLAGPCNVPLGPATNGCCNGYVQSSELGQTAENIGQDSPTEAEYVLHEPVAFANTCGPVTLPAAGGYVQSAEFGRTTNIPPCGDRLTFDMQPSDITAMNRKGFTTTQFNEHTTKQYTTAEYAKEDPFLSDLSVTGNEGVNHYIEDTTHLVNSPTGELAAPQRCSTALSPSISFPSLGECSVQRTVMSPMRPCGQHYLACSKSSGYVSEASTSSHIDATASSDLAMCEREKSSMCSSTQDGYIPAFDTNLCEEAMDDFEAELHTVNRAGCVSHDGIDAVGESFLSSPPVVAAGTADSGSSCENDNSSTTASSDSRAFERSTEDIVTDDYTTAPRTSVCGKLNNEIQKTSTSTSDYVSCDNLIGTETGGGNHNSTSLDMDECDASCYITATETDVCGYNAEPHPASMTAGYVSLGSIVGLSDSCLENPTFIETGTSNNSGSTTCAPLCHSAAVFRVKDTSNTTGGDYISAQEMDSCAACDHTCNEKTTGYVTCDITTGCRDPFLRDQSVPKAHVPVSTELTPTIFSPSLSELSFGGSLLPGSLLSSVQPSGQHYVAGSESSGYFSEPSTSSYSNAYCGTFEQTTDSDLTSDPVTSASHDRHNVQRYPAFNDCKGYVTEDNVECTQPNEHVNLHSSTTNTNSYVHW